MKKIIAPFIIAVLFIVFFIGLMIACFLSEEPDFIKIIGAVVFLSLIGVSIFVLIERIKEIRSGEEDDLGKY
jgi:hypothetical protein